MGASHSSTADSGPVLVGEVTLASSNPRPRGRDESGYGREFAAPIRPGVLLASPTRRQLIAGAGAAAALFSAYGYLRPGTASADVRNRHVVHARGSTAVPIKARRVVILGDGLLDLTLALGILPIAASSVEAPEATHDGPFYSWLGPPGGAIASVGMRAAPNLERLAAMRPDLVVGEFADDASYARVAAVAPTVALDTAHVDWQTEILPRLAALLGRSPGDAQAVLAPYRARVQRLRRRLGDPANTVVSLVANIGSEPVMTVLCPQHPGNQVLRDLGFARPRTWPFAAHARGGPPQPRTGVGSDIVIDRLFHRSDARTAQLCADRSWIPVASMRAERAHAVGAAWSCAGPSAAGVVLDDLERWLIREGR